MDDVQQALLRVERGYPLPEDGATIRDHIATLQSRIDALTADAERLDFLDTVPIVVHVSNGRRYECGPGNARDIIDMAQRYHAARQQEAARES